MEQNATGWILSEDGEPVGCGPNQHAAIADGRRWTKWPESCRQRVDRATAEVVFCFRVHHAAAAAVSPPGPRLSVNYRRPVDAA